MNIPYLPQYNAETVGYGKIKIQKVDIARSIT